MKRNVGHIDKIIRVLAGIIVLALGLLLGSWWGLVGLVLLATGLVGWCPLYTLFGFSTCHLDTRSAR